MLLLVLVLLSGVVGRMHVIGTRSRAAGLMDGANHHHPTGKIPTFERVPLYFVNNCHHRTGTRMVKSQ